MQLNLLKVDQQNAFLKKLERRAPVRARHDFFEQLRLCWVFHDHAIDGDPLNEIELQRGIRDEPGKDTCEQAMLTGIHRLYEATLTVAREAQRGVHVDLAYIKHLHVLVSDPEDPGAGRYRKCDGPLGSYMHKAVGPKSISYRLRKLVDYIEEEAPGLHPIRAAAIIHHAFMGVFPFDALSGRAGRLLLNVWLMREGYPPVIIPAGLRSEYYDALCEDTPEALVNLVIDILMTTIERTRETYKQQLSSYARAS